MDIRSRLSAGVWNNTGQDVESVSDLPQPNSQQKGKKNNAFITNT